MYKTKCTFRNIAAILYKGGWQLLPVGAKYNVVNHLYTTSEFGFCKQACINIDVGKNDKQISLHYANLSVSGANERFSNEVCLSAQKVFNKFV